MPQETEANPILPLRGRRDWAAFASFWLVVTLALTVGRYFGGLTIGTPVEWWTGFRYNLVHAVASALGALVALAAATRLPLDGGRWRSSLAVHGFLAVAVVTCNAGALYLLSRVFVFMGQLSFVTRLQVAPTEIFFYVSWAGVGYALLHRRQYRIRDLQAAEYEARLARTRLNALRSQPHSNYISVGLTALKELLRRSPADAGNLLSRLADFLRLSMENAGIANGQFADEVSLAEAYLEVERIVREGHLEVDWHIDPGALDVMVPHPVLQRLVEAVIGGERKRAGRLTKLEISAEVVGQSLEVIVVSDPGGRGEPLPLGLGRLEWLRHDLEEVFGDKFDLVPTVLEGSGLQVRLTLPAAGGIEEVYEVVDAGAEIPLSPPPVRPAAPAPAHVDLFRSKGAWLLLFGWWTALALVYANMYYVVSGARGFPMPAWRALGFGFVDMYLWGALSVAAFTLARHLPLEDGRWRSSLPVHLAAALVLLPSRLAIEELIAVTVGVLDSIPYTGKLLLQGPSHAMGYAFLVVIGYALDYHRRAREREIAAWEIEAQTTKAQLGALRMQLHPHFLFNTLNAIATLQRTNVEEAIRTTDLLQKLLRTSLARGDAHEVALAEELEVLRAYIEIEKVRHGEHLAVSWQIEPSVLDARVPHLILQPIVENAVRHGIAPRARAGHLEVAAEADGRELVLRVSDDGIGFDPGSPRPSGRRGVGLANTRERLACLYPGTHSFDLASRPGGGTVVTIRLPYAPLAPRRTLRPVESAAAEEVACEYAP